MDTEWCKFHPGPKHDDGRDPNVWAGALFEKTTVSDARELDRSGWEEKLPSRINDEMDKCARSIDDAVRDHLYEEYFEVAWHLSLQEELAPKYPLVVAESLFVNNEIYLEGIQSVLREYVTPTKPLTFLRIDPENGWKESVDQFRDVDDAFYIVLLIEDSNKLDQEFVSNFFHMVKWFKKKVSVIIHTACRELFGHKCSLRTLRQFETLSIQVGGLERLSDLLLQQVTFKCQSVLQLDPALLAFLRYKFLCVSGSIEIFKNSHKFALLNHTIENPHWCLKDGTVFHKLVQCYWKVVLYLSENLKDNALCVHQSIQENTFFSNASTVGAKYRSWIADVEVERLLDVATFLVDVCEKTEQTCLDHIDIKTNLKRLIKYLDRCKSQVSMEKNLIDLPRILDSRQLVNKMFVATAPKQIMSIRTQAVHDVSDEFERVLKRLLRPFSLFPDGRFFVVNTKTVRDLEMDPHAMEITLLKTDDDVGRCYRALLTSGKLKRISLKEWATLFCEKSKEIDQRMKMASFFNSISILERCGIVGTSDTTPKGFADIFFRSRIDDLSAYLHC